MDVGILNVPPIFAQMGGDPVGSGLLAQHGRRHRIGFGAATRLPHRGDVIDVHIQALVAKRHYWGIR